LLVRLWIEAATHVLTALVTVHAFAAALIALVPFQFSLTLWTDRLRIAVSVE